MYTFDLRKESFTDGKESIGLFSDELRRATTVTRVDTEIKDAHIRYNLETGEVYMDFINCRDARQYAYVGNIYNDGFRNVKKEICKNLEGGI